MIKICKRLFKFFITGALIFIASYYAMGEDDEILINTGLILLAAAFLSKIVETNLLKKKYK
jgi:hypothetical protein